MPGTYGIVRKSMASPIQSFSSSMDAAFAVDDRLAAPTPVAAKVLSKARLVMLGVFLFGTVYSLNLKRVQGQDRHLAIFLAYRVDHVHVALVLPDPGVLPTVVFVLAIEPWLNSLAVADTPIASQDTLPGSTNCYGQRPADTGSAAITDQVPLPGTENAGVGLAV